MASALLALLLVALGGFAGTVARVWLTETVDTRWGDRFPAGTLTVNATGALLIGVLAGTVLDPAAPAAAHSLLWLGLAAGTLGSFTTVSSFSLQTLALLRAGRTGTAAINIAGSLALCLAAAALGLVIGGTVS
ncbi:CrcB family protein [Glycocaulis profundi]|nr:CrcB family protein [Glycocaulis profundi]